MEKSLTVAGLVAKPEYQCRFNEVLGKRAPQFLSSLVSASNSPSLRNAEPKSVIASAMVAATLDLPIDKNLGFSHIVAYGNVAQFQMGYKGYIQLALRTGQYKTINDSVIPHGAFVSYNELTGDLIIDWEKSDYSKPAAGYACFFRLVNGFEKLVYWPREKVERHGKQYSKSFGNSSSPWKTQFDAMALKTVIKATLSKYGILSIELATAFKHDQGTQKDVDSEVVYADNDNISFEEKKVVPFEPVAPKVEPPPLTLDSNPPDLLERLRIVTGEYGSTQEAICAEMVKLKRAPSTAKTYDELTDDQAVWLEKNIDAVISGKAEARK